MKLFPDFMVSEVLRYSRVSDQKCRLVARLILIYCLLEDGKKNLIYNWRRDKYNKPVINGWYDFSISHSDRMVLFSYGNNRHGVDIEKITDLDYIDLISYFDASEQNFILKSDDPQKTFYEIWVKKEAGLKAIGVGISNGLEKFLCLSDCANQFSTDWYFTKLLFSDKYVAYLCSSSADKPNTKKISNFGSLLMGD
ncbi:MAG: 4'-phosphopantetheinyl transferase superfamily protein [Chitinophagaceae bacterium]|nr:4'-phosphopantetheinyl transferase superfamily protein [Chitinophagaceae bacterium]